MAKRRSKRRTKKCRFGKLKHPKGRRICKKRRARRSRR